VTCRSAWSLGGALDKVVLLGVALAGLIASLVLSAEVQARDKPPAWATLPNSVGDTCVGGSAEASIEACTRILELTALDKSFMAREYTMIMLEGRARSYRLLGRFNEAIADYHRLAALTEDDHNAGLAATYSDRGWSRINVARDCEAAVADFDLSIATARLPGAFHGRATCYRYMGNLERALSDANAAVELLDLVFATPETHVGVLNSRAAIFSALGKHLEALADYGGALETDPNDPVALKGREFEQQAIFNDTVLPAEPAHADGEASTTRPDNPVLLAAQAGASDIVRILIEGGEAIDEPDEEGWTALAWAVANGDADTVQALVEAGASGGAAELDAAPVVIAAVQGGSSALVGILLQAPFSPAEINRATFIAAARHDEEFVRAIGKAVGFNPLASPLVVGLAQSVGYPLMVEGMITPEFALAAYKLCEEAGLLETEACLAIREWP
jgi:tetratricopeptide (TPR) repeat protein